MLSTSPIRQALGRGESRMPSQFVSKLVQVCEEECAFFGNGAKKEYKDSVFERVGLYWSRLAEIPQYKSWAGYNGKSGVKLDKNGEPIKDGNRNQPWSAAFISYVMHKAGADDHFAYAPSHSVYIVRALDQAKKAKPSSPFVARRHKQYSPKLGDLIACERKPAVDPNFDTYKSFVAQGKYEAHCDVVTEVHEKHVMTIGGNVSNSVTRKKWPLDAGKMIGNHDPLSATAGVICIIENRL